MHTSVLLFLFLFHFLFLFLFFFFLCFILSLVLFRYRYHHLFVLFLRFFTILFQLLSLWQCSLGSTQRQIKLAVVETSIALISLSLFLLFSIVPLLYVPTLQRQ